MTVTGLVFIPLELTWIVILHSYGDKFLKGAQIIVGLRSVIRRIFLREKVPISPTGTISYFA